MSTTGVKRVGLGYQSDNVAAKTVRSVKAPTGKRFLTGRRPMPPPVSSEDLRRAASTSADEFGAIIERPSSMVPSKEDKSHSAGLVRRALKAMTVKL